MLKSQAPFINDTEALTETWRYTEQSKQKAGDFELKQCFSTITTKTKTYHDFVVLVTWCEKKKLGLLGKHLTPHFHWSEGVRRQCNICKKLQQRFSVSSWFWGVSPSFLQSDYTILFKDLNKATV